MASSQHSDPLAPSAALLCKLGSIIVHADEGMSSSGHEFDIETLKVLLADPEVSAWLVSMGAMGLLPVKR